MIIYSVKSAPCSRYLVYFEETRFFSGIIMRHVACYYMGCNSSFTTFTFSHMFVDADVVFAQ